MGVWNWLQHKSAEQCRTNLTRGFPLLVKTCEQISACLEQERPPSQRDINERKRLAEMLYLNVASQLLPPQETFDIVQRTVGHPEQYGRYTGFQLQQVMVTIMAEIQQHPGSAWMARS